MKTRRFVSVFFALVLMLNLTAVAWAEPAEGEASVMDVAAKAALLVDGDTGEVLYAKNEHAELYPASITKVMTAILENLEVSNLVIASREHILDIFGSEDASHVFKSNIEFYCPNFICLDEGNADIFASGKTGSIAINDKARDNEIAADASFLAGTAFSIINNDIACTAIDSTPFDTWLKIAEEGVRFAANTAHDSRTIDAAFAARQAADIASHLSFQP